jgi:hypothetical protein
MHRFIYRSLYFQNHHSSCCLLFILYMKFVCLHVYWFLTVDSLAFSYSAFVTLLLLFILPHRQICSHEHIVEVTNAIILTMLVVLSTSSTLSIFFTQCLPHEQNRIASKLFCCISAFVTHVCMIVVLYLCRFASPYVNLTIYVSHP